MALYFYFFFYQIVSAFLFSNSKRENFFYSDDVRDKMKTRYLSNPDYNFEKVNRASLACGPMVKWAIAQVTCRAIVFCIIFNFENRH